MLGLGRWVLTQMSPAVLNPESALPIKPQLRVGYGCFNRDRMGTRQREAFLLGFNDLFQKTMEDSFFYKFSSPLYGVRFRKMN